MAKPQCSSPERHGGADKQRRQSKQHGISEFGPLLLSNYPGAGFTPRFRYNNFRQILDSNPCGA